MRFIFLDIDGVMVPAKSWSSPEILNDGFAAFTSKSVNVLNSIITDDDIVMLTTSHKANYTIVEWKNIFNKRGLRIKNIQRLPENSNYLTRKDEITNWFNLNEWPQQFVILDDDKSLNDLSLNIKNNLVQTSKEVGLTNIHLQEIKSILENPKEYA